MHGGKSKGPVTTRGWGFCKSAFRHGARTKEFLALHKEAIGLIHQNKNVLFNGLDLLQTDSRINKSHSLL
jgi:hypothetical protein